MRNSTDLDLEGTYDKGHIYFEYNLLSNWLTYSMYSVLVALGVDSSGSLLTYNTKLLF